MGRLIDADVLKEYIDEQKGRPFIGCTIGEALKIMTDEQPTVDAEPVRHGKWIDIDSQMYTWKVRCDQCGHERSMMSTQGRYPRYCENCGAKMDAQEKDDDRKID